MSKQSLLFVGLGEIGLSLFELAKENTIFSVYGLDLDKKRMRSIDQRALPEVVKVIHICIPCSSRESFVKIVEECYAHFKPKLMIIHSTVPPGTTISIHKKCKNCLVVHSPIRGVHKSTDYMKWELKRWTKYVGGATLQAGEAACEHLEKLGLKTKILKSCLETELAKMFETTYRAWMIACFQEMHRISMHFKADFGEVIDFLQDTHNVRSDRPVMFPDVIGGHCLIPNIELLLKDYNSEFLRLILKSNERRKRELGTKEVRGEVERIKKQVRSNERNLQ